MFCPHFLWCDGQADYDFGVERYLKWWERFWFKGEIRKRKIGWNQHWKQSYYEEIGEVEYDLHCAKCSKYLEHFVYGYWEY